MSDEPIVHSQAQVREALAAGQEIVEAQICIGMSCDICGPIDYPRDRLLLRDEADSYLSLHWQWKHPGVPRRGEREQVMDGQYRKERLDLPSTTNHKEH